MFFDHLKYDYEEFLKDHTYKIENKQRLNISNHSYITIQNDLLVFDDKKEKIDNIESGVINQIFRNYRRQANVSVSQSLCRKEAEYENIFEEILDQNLKKQVIELLLHDYENEMRTKIDDLLKIKEYAFYFRIDSNNIEYLASDEGQAEADYYKNNVAHYIKAVVEEYTSLPYVERECVYHKTLIEKIHHSITNGKVLKIVLRNKSKSNKSFSNNIIYFKPYEIRTDKESTYNYLIGYSNYNRKGTWTLSSIRITSIKNCEILEQRAFISIEQKKNLREEIKRKGVQYLSAHSHDDNIIIELSDFGEKMYHRMLNQRPLYTKKIKDKVYEFNCSFQQAENYFFKFGKEIRILAPEELKKVFINKYESALENYK